MFIYTIGDIAGLILICLLAVCLVLGGLYKLALAIKQFINSKRTE